MKWFYIIGVAAVSAAVAGCSDKAAAPKQAQAKTAASEPAANDLPVYRVAKDITYAPYVMHDKGKHIGFEVDILDAVAKNQGFRVEYVTQPWDQLFVDLDKNDLVMSLGGTSVEDVNQEVSTPTVSYISSLDCMAALSPADLEQWQTKKIAVTADGGMDEVLIKDYGIAKDRIAAQADSHYMILSALAKKEAQVGVGDCASLRYNAISPTFKDYTVTVKELPKSVEDDSTRLVFSVRKDQPELLAKVNAGLKAIEQNGELAAIKRKWGQH